VSVFELTVVDVVLNLWTGWTTEQHQTVRDNSNEENEETSSRSSTKSERNNRNKTKKSKKHTLKRSSANSNSISTRQNKKQKDSVQNEATEQQQQQQQQQQQDVISQSQSQSQSQSHPQRNVDNMDLNLTHKRKAHMISSVGKETSEEEEVTSSHPVKRRRES
jgi:hypothetical protein